MKTTSKIFLSCLLCLALPFASGYGNEGGYGNEDSATLPANPAEQERQAGERMVLTIKDVSAAWYECDVFFAGGNRCRDSWSFAAEFVAEN